MAADYRYDYLSGISYPNQLPYDSSEGCFVPSDLPPRNQIYTTNMMNLAKPTSINLEILKAKLIAADPGYYDFGPQQWDPNRKWEEYEEFSNDILENTRSKYDQHGVHFSMERHNQKLGYQSGPQLTDVKAKPKRVRKKDDEDESDLVASFCYLCTTLDEHKKHIARRGLQMKAKEKVQPRIKFIPPPPVVNPKRKEEEEKAEVLYKVSVTTGAQPLAATSAKVSFILRGRDGVMKKKDLTKKSSVNFTFGRGTTENFFIKGPKIGKLRSLTIMHDGLEKKHSWYLERITITVMSSGQVFVFPCKQWLSLYFGDMKLKRTLEAHVEEMLDVRRDYEVAVTTADKLGAGTDANVFLTIYGKKGISSRFPLRNKSKNNFEAGQEDKFRVMVEKDIGTLTKIRLEHDNRGVGPGWFVEKVVLTDTATGQLWTFPCGQWLAKDEGDGKTFKDLHPLPDQKRHHGGKGRKGRSGERGPQLWYKFSVVTGTRRHAGTDAHVFITLLGALGKSQDVALDDGKDHFEKGQTDVFKRKAEDVGNLKRIIVRHDNAGLAAGWYLDTVVVRRFFSSQEVKQRLAEMASEMHDHVSTITGEDIPSTPTKKRTAKHQRSVSFESLKEQERKEKKKKYRYDDEEEEEEEEEDELRGRKRKERMKEQERKGKKKKHRYDDEEEEEEEEWRARRNQWDEDEEEEEQRGRKNKEKRSGSRSKLGRIDEEEYEHRDKKRKGKSKRKSKHCYVESSSSSLSSSSCESDDEDHHYSKRKHEKDYKQKNRQRQKTNQKKRNGYTAKRKEESSSDSSSSSSSSEVDEAEYTKWTKGRVPYCDEYVFKCNRWLATDEDDGLLQRELKPKSVTTIYKIE